MGMFYPVMLTSFKNASPLINTQSQGIIYLGTNTSPGTNNLEEIY